MLFVGMLQFRRINNAIVGPNEGEGDGNANRDAKRGAQGGKERAGLELVDKSQHVEAFSLLEATQ